MTCTVINLRQSLWRCICGLILTFAAGLIQAQSLSKMALLLPDGLALTEAQVGAWTDAAQEQGYKLGILRNTAFLQAGPGIRSQYSGIIIPDQMQVSMSDALISSIENYVMQGGNIMLVYDAGALTAGGFYAVPKSRFSNLVGVDYVLYDQLRERTIGLGPVIGQVSTLRALQIPPGKSMLYPPTVSAALASTSGTARTASTVLPPDTTAHFLPAHPLNPGGLARHDHSLYFKRQQDARAFEPGQSRQSPDQQDKKLKRDGKDLKHAGAVQREPVANSTSAAFSTLAAIADPVHSISGYVYGALSYPSFVTQGTAQGTVLFSSPQHGLVASSRALGSGSVLFVNMPLTYLKLSDDGMPLHGFLHWFARGPLKLPRLTDVPNGVGGLVFNWHLDSNAALEPMQTLKNMGVWKHKPFSIDITAGPDTIVPGDKLGFDLPNNTRAQQFLKDFDAQGHEVGSHGGWIHDYYVNNASETNESQFVNYLKLNRNAVEAVIGHPISEYSAPQGNNPLWALRWLEQNGVGSYYSLSHTGTSATRTYRGGKLVSPSLWAFPVMPLGVAATFEEFDELQIPEQDINQWYTQLIDFSVSGGTNRLIYAHPPGAVLYPNVMSNLLQYARQKQQAGQFRWYTMTRLAAFMTKRSAITWDSAVSASGRMRVTASHPSSLDSMAWTYPKTLYSRPVAVSGSMTIIDHGSDWLVRVNGGRAVVFEATPL